MTHYKMITFKQFIAEAFDKPAPYEKVLGGNESMFSFTIGDRNYYVSINKREVPGRDWNGKLVHVYSIGFTVGGANYSLTRRNDGTQFRILATVKVIIFNYFKNVRLNTGDMIVFDTYDPSTAKLYTKFANELAKKLNMKLTTGVLQDGGKDFELLK